MASKEALTRVLSFIPPLSKQLHKGQAGMPAAAFAHSRTKWRA